jgi:two-component system, NarL family, nitrate/nitrite response regulator NarL
MDPADDAPHPAARGASSPAATRGDPGPIRLYVADSYPICIEGVSSELSRHDGIVLVGNALTWQESAREIAALGPDVVLIEDSLPGSCTAALAALEALESAPRVVFLADSVETASVYEAMAVGAAGYLTRNIGPGELVRAIRDTFDGRTALAPELQTQLAEEIRVRATGPSVAVSNRERRALQLIADGLATKEIARLLAVSPATVKNDLSATFAKLGVHDRAAAVAEGMRRGILD